MLARLTLLWLACSILPAAATPAVTSPPPFLHSSLSPSLSPPLTPILPARASDGVLVRYRTAARDAHQASQARSRAPSDRVRHWVNAHTAVLMLPEPGINSADAAQSSANATQGSANPAQARAATAPPASVPDDDARRLAAYLQQLRQRPDVLWAEANYRGRFADLPPAAAPNDPRYAEQWALASIGAPALWAITQGAGVRVAVIDTGVDPYHPDLSGRIAGASRSVADANGQIQDRIGHGTGVAGLIVAQHNNGQGIAGLTPAAELLVIKVNAAGEDSFTSAHLAEAIDYAVAAGAAVINLSLTATPTETVREAVQHALAAGRVVVAAAGNNRGAVEFPANEPGVLGVAGHTAGGQLVSGSNYGNGVALAAPGENVLTTDLAGGYRWRSGTSFAAPLVSASAAALLAIQPGLDPASLLAWLRTHAQPMQAIPGGAPIGDFGRLAAGSSGQALLPALHSPSPRLAPGMPLTLNLYLPPCPRAADLYLALQTPDGRLISLQADGQWRDVSGSIGTPMATPLVATVAGYQQPHRQQLVLFGSNGLLPAISTAGAASGAYRLLGALVERGSGRLIGAINPNPLEVLP